MFVGAPVGVPVAVPLADVRPLALALPVPVAVGAPLPEPPALRVAPPVSDGDVEALALAVDVARIPELIKGFGHVKERNVKTARLQWVGLMKDFSLSTSAETAHQAAA